MTSPHRYRLIAGGAGADGLPDTGVSDHRKRDNPREDPGSADRGRDCTCTDPAERRVGRYREELIAAASAIVHAMAAGALESTNVELLDDAVSCLRRARAEVQKADGSRRLVRAVL